MMNRITLKEAKLKVLEKLPPKGIALPLAELLSQYAADPGGPSVARASILELKEEGELDVDDTGNLMRCK